MAARYYRSRRFAAMRVPSQVAVLREQLYRERQRNQRLTTELAQTRRELSQLREHFSAEVAEQVQHHTLQWQLFQRLSQEIGATLSYEDLFRSILGHVHLLVPCEVSAGLIITADACELFWHHYRPLGTHIQTDVLHRLLDELSRVNEVDLARQSLRLHHLHPAEPVQGEPIARMASYVLVPIAMLPQDDQETLGLLLVGAEEPERFTEEHRSIVSSIANQASASVQQLQLLLNQAQLGASGIPRPAPMLAKAQDGLSELKSRVIRTISHEYRTPLTIISLAAESLAQEYPRLNAAQRQRCFAEINRATRQMTRLVNEVLWLSQAEAGEISVQLRAVQLADFIAQTMDEVCRHQVEWRDRVIYEGVEPAEIGFWSDPLLLQAIAQHLLTNALKYSPIESLVQWQIALTAEGLQLTVRDRGIGIPEAEQPHIFDCFHRADNVCTLPGTGMGLTIVKRCVDLLAGTIQFQSQLGEGSVFTVQIPLLARQG